MHSRSNSFGHGCRLINRGSVERLDHGHVSLLRRLGGGLVEKVNDSFDAAERAPCELVCLTHLGELLPVPKVVARDPVSLD